MDSIPSTTSPVGQSSARRLFLTLLGEALAHPELSQQKASPLTTPPIEGSRGITKPDESVGDLTVRPEVERALRQFEREYVGLVARHVGADRVEEVLLALEDARAGVYLRARAQSTKALAQLGEELERYMWGVVHGETYRLVETHAGEAPVRAEPFDAIELDWGALWQR